MEPTRILAIRHGETAWNVDTRIQGHLDIPLNGTGQWQARRLAQALAGNDLIHAVVITFYNRTLGRYKYQDRSFFALYII